MKGLPVGRAVERVPWTVVNPAAGRKIPGRRVRSQEAGDNERKGIESPPRRRKLTAKTTRSRFDARAAPGYLRAGMIAAPSQTGYMILTFTCRKMKDSEAPPPGFCRLLKGKPRFFGRNSFFSFVLPARNVGNTFRNVLLRNAIPLKPGRENFTSTFRKTSDSESLSPFLAVVQGRILRSSPGFPRETHFEIFNYEDLIKGRHHLAEDSEISVFFFGRGVFFDAGAIENFEMIF